MKVKGVNTGFGGSADTRTDDTEALQHALLDHLQSGVLASQSSNGNHHLTNGNTQSSTHSGTAEMLSKAALPNGDVLAATSMPEAWVRASLLVRCNSLAGGHSGVRLTLLQGLVEFLRKDLVPIIPLRGSISASGDLCPLSYIAGALRGDPGLNVQTRNRKTGQRHAVAANVALADASLPCHSLGAKEGLAIVNGTAVSAGIAALALHDAHGLAVISQILTAMSVEALQGSLESFDPFLASVRPHLGQVEASRNIRGFLTGSKLVCSDQSSSHTSLRQDRYAIRTSTQWIGPQLENLVSAHKQIAIECSSITDNPIIDRLGGRVLHGGNFQAMAVTSAMEKTRSTLQIIGRMLFAQCTEMMNPALNNGLPPSLASDEPSQSFLLKGVDVNTASLQAELGFLANPIASHVQTAEMNNQSLNSLALISARYTHIALDILSQLVAAHMLSVCQALDLRAMHFQFLAALKPAFESVTYEQFGHLLQPEELTCLHEKLWLDLQRELKATTSLDSSHRFPQVTRSLQTTVIASGVYKMENSTGFGNALEDWTRRCSMLCLQTFYKSRERYFSSPDATDFLGSASCRMYRFIRQDLQVPFLRNRGKSESQGWADQSDTGADGNPKIGSLVSIIYESIRNGGLYVPTMECLREVWQEDT